MALNSINRDFDKRTRDVSLLAKDFSSYRQRLIDFAKSYFPNQYNDFSSSSVGNMFIELVSYACDVLSYNVDYNLKESILTSASEQKNIISIAQSLGYKVPLSSPATTRLKVYQLLPDNNGEPDFRYALKIASGMKVISSSNSDIIFRTTEEIDFSRNEIISNPDSKYSVFEEDDDGVLFWLLEYYKEVAVVAERQQKTLTIDVSDPKQFLTIEIPDADVTNILSITDSDNNAYFEVQSLAQDTIIDSVELTDATELPKFEPVIRRVPRRFITRVNKNLKLEVQFGAGTSDEEDSDVIKSLDNILSNATSTDDLPIDPVSFSTAKTYGKVPSNTTLTIRYSVGGGVESNVPQNDLTGLNEIDILTLDTAVPDAGVLSNIKSTISFTNEEPATGGSDIPTIDEIRQNALQHFSTQNRAVTASDYKARVLAMPTKFGNIAKAVARKHQPGNNTTPTSTIDIHLLGYDSNNNLTTLNTQTKKNLSTYLNEYRLLTDGVNLLDGFILNIGVDFSISVYNGYNSNTVLLESIEKIKQFFDINKQDFFQPIYLSDLQLSIANVDGVRSVNEVKIKNLNGDGFSNIIYDIDEALKNGIIYPSIEPSVFEIKYPNQDINGRVE